ncbi:uncharacterized protein PFL1_01580 [Pseudozyma flocculosa PF-1]|uniref:Related to Probable alpha/beta-glucosidase agdC n=1 Tax=Pseudozyma flocculosa TaxID=84751 RepID=A0A5C3F0L8_9BASI|nr:uncharacterized protein PFL1_01580 [Pseudozyma flocculosa PF-1]EPQ30679.1 hypothetical protein PFL1_01580 [Pseudozyma flocculosa PF-1]SPO36989.1 related to Probable alpha/beta-glucosidase agdC [Pseudozyma flocculosa]
MRTSFAALASLVALATSLAAANPVLVPRQDAKEVPPKFIPSPVEHTADVDSCPGYAASDVKTTAHGLTATLRLAGDPCSAYGPDYPVLKLAVNYDSQDRLRVRITDAENKAHVVPQDIGRYPEFGSTGVSKDKSKLKFEHVDSPFSFKVSRGDEVLFDTAGSPLIFEEQYVRLRTSLPENASIYGVGDHNDNLRLPITQANYSRTLWARDAYGVPSRTNLYGSHPIYFDHRLTDSGPSTHGVFLLTSNGLDVKFPDGGRALEYNTLGGIIDLFFMQGPDPTSVAKQYTDVIGRPVGSPYWGLGLHQCRYGYRDVYEVAEVVANYSAAGIPLETMWTDIDYMDKRAIFTTNPDNYPLDKVRSLVDTLHDNDQHYVLMIDPAMAVRDNYPSLERAKEQDVLLKNEDGSLYDSGVVWPGRVVFPDWFAANTSKWWTSEVERFFSPKTGVDVDAIWIDMNEPASFLPYLEANPDRVSEEKNLPPVAPPVRNPPPRVPGFFQKRQSDEASAQLDNKWLYPPYRINDVRAAPSGADGVVDAGVSKNISDFTASTALVHANGEREYDVHNIYGHMMGAETRKALLNRRPGERPLIITRSTFAGSGNSTGKWLGDNLSEWAGYTSTIRQMLAFASIYQIPVVGADTCGFGNNATETLCARWAFLGAFSPFFRNHNGEPPNIGQEFYRWPLVTEAAKKALDIRYRLLDYLYTALHEAEQTGKPVLSPLFYKHPADAQTFGIETQFYYGDHLLVSPAMAENSTTAEFYVPDDLFYDFFTLQPVRGEGKNVTQKAEYTDIPLHIRGGAVVPMRSEGAMTTTELRTRDFTLVVAPDAEGRASGYLRLDDGVSIHSKTASDIRFAFADDKLTVDGSFGYRTKVHFDKVVFANVDRARSAVLGGKKVDAKSVVYSAENRTLTLSGLKFKIQRGFTIRLE